MNDCLSHDGPQPRCRLNTAHGAVDLYVPAAPELVDSLRVDPGIGAFWQYRRGHRQQALLREIAASTDGCVALAVVGETIAGFLLLCQPGIWERWARVPGVYELSIEVGRGWRRLGLAHHLLRASLADALWEQRIVVAQGYHWHWDIEQSGLAIWEYRELFQKLFAAHGFAVFDSDEPDIYFDRSNIIMARIGAACSSGQRRAFLKDLFRVHRRPEWLDAAINGLAG